MVICTFFCSQIFPLCAITNLKFENITDKDGLSQNTVRSIMQDSRGFMWFATLNGLNRYNGIEFVVIQPQFNSSFLAGKNTRDMVEDCNGHIWIFSVSGIADCYDTQTESFVDYTGKNCPGNYRNIKIMWNGDVWLWGKTGGACHIRYVDGKLISKVYGEDNIRTNTVKVVFEDSNHQIWLGTDRELYKINQGIPELCITEDDNLNFQAANELGKYIYFFTQNNKVIKMDKNRKKYSGTIAFPFQVEKFTVNQTAVLDEKNILITGDIGTYLLNTELEKITSARKFFDNEELKQTRILFDNKGVAWIYNKSGNIWHYDTVEHKFKHYTLIPKSILSHIDLERYGIFSDSQGINWISTYGNGLFALDSETLTHFTRNNSGLKSNFLLAVYEDKLGEIWIGGEHTGITKISPTKYRYDIFYPDPDKSNLENKTVKTVFQSSSGDIWIGTKSNKIFVFDKNLRLKNNLSISHGAMYCMVEDNNGNKWVGTKGNGLLFFPAGKNKYSTFTHSLQDSMSVASNNIYSLLIDSKETLWIGTYGGGLQYCEKNGERLNFRRLSVISDKQSALHSLVQDSDGLIWAGGNGGIIVFDPACIVRNPNNFRQFRFDPGNRNSISFNNVKCLFRDSKGRIWVGTAGGGLNRAVKNQADGKIHFVHYSVTEGLVNNVVQSIAEDDNHNLWIGTESGLSKFNPETGIFENHHFSDEWENNTFCETACLKTKDGRLMFGNYNGMYILHPSSFTSRSSNLPVLLTNLFIGGIPAVPGGKDSPLNKSIVETESIKLKNGQNSFSIAFSSLNFKSENAVRYTYILENYDNRWNPITPYNVAAYKNVPAGKYIFRVKGVNNSEGIADRETVLKITVLPPIWKSPWAILIYIVLFAVIAIVAAQNLLKINRLRNAIEIEKHLTDYRLRFFTNISHEFRSPLTIIKGSIDNINDTKRLPPSLKKQAEILEKSVLRLMRLVDQLLEFRKIQNDKMELVQQDTDIVLFFRDIFNMFEESAKQNNIHYTFSSGRDSKVVYIDREKMDKILYNLLSNAFKHTPKNGNISVNICFNDEGNNWQLTVSDSGSGIPADKRNLLFERFRQINHTTSGIGIGLNLTNELVRLHQGTIVYSDSKWGGASFTITIPLLSGNDNIVHSVADATVSAYNDENNVENKLAKPLNAYKILIIDDDYDIRLFLNEFLQNIFTVFTASNGSEGLAVAAQEQPSLIICDVMMPEMDGFELTRKLKSDFNSSHIPVILLTAMSATEQQIEGIQAGADAYIVKPFNTKFLLARIVKLIEQREKLQQKFSRESGTNLTTIVTTDKDKEFLKKANAIIEKELDNSSFSVELFAQSANLGKTMLYKKIKGITGYSPNEFIRIIRIKKAADLLKTTELNISEIAYKVGFEDPLYFSRCFKEQFSLSPRQFRTFILKRK
jgi:signal transduction histidine kinase/ligand-binding sensor domain-containing protein/DNA-binding response OmpR family regulator